MNVKSKVSREIKKRNNSFVNRIVKKNISWEMKKHKESSEKKTITMLTKMVENECKKQSFT